MNKEIKFEVIKDKVFKKEVDNLILMIETAVLARPDNIEKLELDIVHHKEVVGALDAMKLIDVKNPYANHIISNAELKSVEAENKLSNYLLGNVPYDKFKEQIFENFEENNTGHRRYNINFFENIIQLAAMFGLTDDLTKEEKEVREALLKKAKEAKENDDNAEETNIS